MITKAGLIIRAIELSDLPTLLTWNTENSRGEFLDLQFKSLETLTAHFHQDGFLSDSEKMVMVETVEGEPIGVIYILFKRVGLANIGMSLCNLSYRYHGYGSKATALIVEYLYNNFPLARVEAETDVDNLTAQNVLENAGFKREGILRKYRYHHGCWRDFIIYSILPEELNTALIR